MKFFLICLPSVCIFTGALALEEAKFESISAQQDTQSLSDKDLGTSQKNLALDLYKDQETIEAIKVFLKALENAQLLEPVTMGHDEKVFYDGALGIYLNPRNSPYESATIIKKRYGINFFSHPAYYHLGYLVAIAYANLSQFDRFFNLFYASYRRLPEHYLAYKAKAILHNKLYDFAKKLEEKEKERQLIVENLQMAKKLYPKDFSLYKMEILFSENQAKNDVVERNVKELLLNHYIIPRNELPFYIDELLAHGHFDLAKELIKNAKEWYPFGRGLDSAEEFINHKQSLKE
ncbi:Uncharacterized protein PHSC3_000334 [Chlamydiales bacterium STE3]|nr:Uncharacterized protein PHSC3_000334 [Chlamydiales bacterium STE3]